MEKQNKLLIVEDDELNRLVYQAMFEKHFTTVICKNAKEFNTAIEQEKFDIFLIDLSLLGSKDGIALIKEIRNRDGYNTTPIMVVTAHTFKTDEENAMNAGATKFFKKPIDNKVLIHEFQKCLELD